jgi:hypothetical protein
MLINKGRRLIFGGWQHSLLPLALVYLAMFAIAPSHTQPSANDRIIFHFGETTVALEREYVRELFALLKRRPQVAGMPTEYDVPRGQSLLFRVPLEGVIAAHSACRRLGSTVLTYTQILRRTENGFWQEIFRWNTEPTLNPEISRFVPPPQKVDPAWERYRFDSDDLRDYWNEKQVFSNHKLSFSASSIPHVDIQLTSDVEIAFAAADIDCFLHEGVAITRHVRAFVIERMMPKP